MIRLYECHLTVARGVGTEGVTALCHAAAQGHEEVVRQLLRHGASLEVADARGQTPLLWSVTQGHERVVQLLLRHGAKPDAATTAGNTAFHLACKVVCKNVFNPEGMALLKAIADAGVDIAKKNLNGFTGADFLAGAGAHGAQWLSQLDRLLQPTAKGTADASAFPATTALATRGAALPWIAELQSVVAPAQACEPVSRLAAGTIAQATPAGDPPIHVLLSYRTDELSSFANKLRRALNNCGIGQTTMPEIRNHEDNSAQSVDGRTVRGWVKGIGELLYSSKKPAPSMTVAITGTSAVAKAGTKVATWGSPTEHQLTQLDTTIRRLWGGLEDWALLRVLNYAAHEAATIRSRTSVTMVADEAATELVLRQLNQATAADPDIKHPSEGAAKLAIQFRKMLEGVSEVALLDHVGPCITAAEQRLSTSGVEGDSDAEAVRVASQVLLESLDARDAERAAVRKRRRQVQAWTRPSTSVNPSTAEKTAAIAAIGGVGGKAASESRPEITAEQARERKLFKKRQELQHAQEVGPFQAAAVSLQAAARGWMVRCCGGNATMPFDWQRYSAVCSVDAVVAIISRTFGMGDAAQCAAYGTVTQLPLLPSFTLGLQARPISIHLKLWLTTVCMMQVWNECRRRCRECGVAAVCEDLKATCFTCAALQQQAASSPVVATLATYRPHAFCSCTR